jgi:hypothetical protein
MARAPKAAAVEETPQPETRSEPISLRDELEAAAAAALAVGDHAAHALADSLLQDVVSMRNKLAASSVSNEPANIVARLKAIL